MTDLDVPLLDTTPSRKWCTHGEPIHRGSVLVWQRQNASEGEAANG
jgi:hypothetical protein